MSSLKVVVILPTPADDREADQLQGIGIELASFEARIQSMCGAQTVVFDSVSEFEAKKGGLKPPAKQLVSAAASPASVPSNASNPVLSAAFEPPPRGGWLS